MVKVCGWFGDAFVVVFVCLFLNDLNKAQIFKIDLIFTSIMILSSRFLLEVL